MQTKRLTECGAAIAEMKRAQQKGVDTLKRITLELEVAVNEADFSHDEVTPIEAPPIPRTAKR